MQFRDQINDYPQIVLGVLAAVVLTSVVIVWRTVQTSASPQTEDRQGKIYFFDQNTKQLFPVSENTIGPIETKSGPFKGQPAGVRAHVLSCGSCSDRSTHFIGWLSKPVDDEESDLELMRSTDDEQWYVSDSPEAERIIAKANEKCGRNRINYCLPEHVLSP